MVVDVSLLGQAVAQPAVDALELAQPLAETLQPLFYKASLLVGGLVGIYLILLAARVYYERRKVRILEDIRYDLDQMNMHYNVKHSRHHKRVLARMWEKLILYFKKR